MIGTGKKKEAMGRKLSTTATVQLFSLLYLCTYQQKTAKKHTKKDYTHCKVTECVLILIVSKERRLDIAETANKLFLCR